MTNHLKQQNQSPNLNNQDIQHNAKIQKPKLNVPGDKYGKTTNITGKSFKWPFQRYKEFPNWRSDAQDMFPGVQTRTPDFDSRNTIKKTSKLKLTYTIVTCTKPTFRWYLVCRKWSPYAQDMRKSMKVGPKRVWRGDMSVDAMLMSTSDEHKFDTQMVVEAKKCQKKSLCWEMNSLSKRNTVVGKISRN